MLQKQIPIVTTRFNNETWAENISYRSTSNHKGCIYGAPIKMSVKIWGNSLVFVIEMNNSTNKIEGVGLIRNAIQFDKSSTTPINNNNRSNHKVYETRNYNRYIYKSDFRIDRDTIQKYNPRLVTILNHILFKEKTHVKRGSGLTILPEKLLKHQLCNNLNINQELKNIFQQVFTQIMDVETDQRLETEIEPEPEPESEPESEPKTLEPEK